MSVPNAPKGTGPAGRKLWKSVLEEYELEEHELALLSEAVRTRDLCATLQERVDEDGPLIMVRGDLRSHPAAVELRLQRVLLARLIVALRVPIGDQADDAPKRNQRRGSRGVYQIRGVA